MIPFHRIRSRGLLTLSLAVLAGCAAQSESARNDDVAYRESAYPPVAPASRSAAKGGSFDLGQGKIDGYLDNPQAVYILEESGTPSNAEYAAPKKAAARRESRLMILTGSVKLATPEVDSVLDRAEALAARMGGYTDRRDQRSVVLRVPVEKYDEAFRLVRTLGRVLDHETRAQDVTDEYTDIALQIRIKKLYLQKLQEILVKETDLERRKSLIHEIQTITESVEQLERRQSGLKRDAAFSTLTVSCEAIARRSFGSGISDDLAVFRWIHNLQARSVDDRSPEGDRLKLPVPSGMVELPRRDSRRDWMAASPEGCEFRARELDNNPVGDVNFWREAMRLRLAAGFRTADTSTVGPWKVLRMQSGEPGAWGWTLAMKIRDDKLQLAQAFCPDSALDRRMRPAIEKALMEVTP